MKKVKITGAIFTAAIITLASCQKGDIDEVIESGVFDCENLDADVGEPCELVIDDTLFAGTVNDDCECIPIPETFDCETLEANIGDVCETIFDFILFPGTVNEDCECELPEQHSGNCDMGLEVLDSDGEFNYTFSFAQLPEGTTDYMWSVDGVGQGYNLGSEFNYTFDSSGPHTIRVSAYLNSADQSVFMTLCYNSIEIDL